VAANNAAWLISNDVCSRQDLEKALKLGMGLKKELFATVQEFGPSIVVKTLRDLAARHGLFYEPDQFLVNYRG
jgi:enoyl-CoA hydratase/3-hydroxyacyl-CoA dehydrogenase